VSLPPRASDPRLRLQVKEPSIEGACRLKSEVCFASSPVSWFLALSLTAGVAYMGDAPSRGQIVKA